jgi:hypothetical protein
MRSALCERLRAMVGRTRPQVWHSIQRGGEAVDAKNRPEALRIFDRYGWVTNSLAGKDAAHNFWLLVQHQTPEIQQRLLLPWKKPPRKAMHPLSDYAYLYDRVQTGLGKPQHWGSQVKCEKSKPVLYPVDDPSGLDARQRVAPAARPGVPANGLSDPVLRPIRQVDGLPATEDRYAGSIAL